MSTLQNLHARGAAQGDEPGTHSAALGDKLSQRAQAVGGEFGDMVGSASSAATTKAKELLKQQLTVGTDIVSHIARSTRIAGDQLDEAVPQLGSLVKRAADSIEDVARGLRDRSIDEVVQTASELGRQRPVLLFGITAALGYLAYRLVNEGVQERNDPSPS